jgi:branched-chain amino acid aminotransferase
MRIPLDDHMVHRGDGVFEMCKCVNSGIYNLEAHLQRLVASMLSIGISLPMTVDALRDIICETTYMSGLHAAAIRVYVSRGPGSFGVNPRDCAEARVYVAVSVLSPSFMDQHPEGARVGLSAIPVKPDYFATMKTCNYLPNVLMKKEAVEHGWDFAVGVDHEGFITEGPTENVGVVTKADQLLFPMTDRVLAGTTMGRVMILAQKLVQQGQLAGVSFGRIRAGEIKQAKEVIIVGTTTDVTHVRSFDEVCWPEQGPVTVALRALLLEDITANANMRTSVSRDF